MIRAKRRELKLSVRSQKKQDHLRKAKNRAKHAKKPLEK
jgi:hypothetical protein